MKQVTTSQLTLVRRHAKQWKATIGTKCSVGSNAGNALQGLQLESRTLSVNQMHTPAAKATYLWEGYHP